MEARSSSSRGSLRPFLKLLMPWPRLRATLGIFLPKSSRRISRMTISSQPPGTPATKSGSAVNGLGLCAGCNYTKEASGWNVVTGSDEKGRHTAEFTTPTGHEHHCMAQAPPGTPRTPMSESEVWLNNRLAA